MNRFDHDPQIRDETGKVFLTKGSFRLFAKYHFDNPVYTSKFHYLYDAHERRVREANVRSAGQAWSKATRYHDAVLDGRQVSLVESKLDFSGIVGSVVHPNGVTEYSYSHLGLDSLIQFVDEFRGIKLARPELATEDILGRESTGMRTMNKGTVEFLLQLTDHHRPPEL